MGGTRSGQTGWRTLRKERVLGNAVEEVRYGESAGRGEQVVRRANSRPSTEFSKKHFQPKGGVFAICSGPFTYCMHNRI